MNNLDQIIRWHKMGWMTTEEAVSELLKADPVRFQRQEHRAFAFLRNN